MSVGKLATALTVIFAVSVLILVAELLYLLCRRRSFRLHSTHNHTSGDSSSKELLYFFCLKAQTRVEPAGAPTQNPDGSSPDDAVIDVFKLLEANGPSRVLCTIKEDDREDVESVSLQECLDSEAAAAAAAAAEVATVEDTKTVVSSPCDSPMFYTPVGSPARDCMSSEFDCPVTGKSGR